MRIRRLAFRVTSLMLLVCASYQGFAAPENMSTDLRILIDVSGSMKKNDPKNLRIPAVKLMAGLLPEEIRAGIWIFSGNTQRLVAWSKVTKKWKRIALRRSFKIHSRGQRTNLEGAIKTAIKGWGGKSTRYHRHLIILTDGMIDISKSANKNSKSRQVVYNKLIPILKRARVKVHTIALSNKADHELLRSLSNQTNGWYRRINDTETLHRIFLKLFESSTTTNKLPIANNHFRVDKSIDDMTVLVFRKKDTKPGALVTPAGKHWTAKKHPRHIKWQHEKSYDLVTIHKPTVGSWGIISKPDPDNRVIIVTNLKLHNTKLPDAIIKGEKLTLQAYLSQSGKPLLEMDFLRLINFFAEGQPLFADRLYLHDDGHGADKKVSDGIYSTRINAFHKAGIQSITLTAKTATFERASQQNMRVYNQAFKVQVKKLPHHKTSLVTAKLQPGLFVPDSASISIVYTDGSRQAMRRQTNGEYRAKAKQQFSGKSVNLELSGMRIGNIKYRTSIAQQLPAFESSVKSMAVASNKHSSHKPKHLTDQRHASHHGNLDKIEHHNKKQGKNRKRHTKQSQKKKHRKNKYRKKKHKKSKRMIASVHWGVIIPGVLVGNALLIGGSVLFFRRKKVVPDEDNGEQTDE